MTKERGRVTPPEQEGSGGGKAIAAKGAKAKSSPTSKLAQSAQAAGQGARSRSEKKDGAVVVTSAAKKGKTTAPASGKAPVSGQAPVSGKPPPPSGKVPASSAKGPPSGKAPVSGKSPISGKRRADEDLGGADLSTPVPPVTASAAHVDRDADPKGWTDGLVERWVRRGQALLQKLAQHGAADHEYRADLKDGRFVWIGPDGNVSAEARAAVLCSWSRSTSVLAMGWVDPVVRYSSVEHIEGMPSEHDNVDEEKAWHLAMEAAELSGAEYLYRVPTPHAWYFLALSELRFDPTLPSFRPGTPVGLVLRELAQTREAIESRAEPSDVIRERLSSFGSALVHQAEYAYRNTDWVARLERTGKTLAQLAGRLPRQSYASVVAGQPSDEWLDRDLAVDLIQAIALLEDEWSMFA
jgi:hypothetical protein